MITNKLEQKKTTFVVLSLAIILSSVAAIQLAASTDVAYAQSTSFPNPPPPPTVTETDCSPAPDGGLYITIKIEDLNYDKGYEYTLEGIKMGAVYDQNFLEYEEGDPVVYTGSEVPDEYPTGFFTKQLTFRISPFDVSQGEVYVFTLYWPSVVSGQVETSVTLCDTEAPLFTVLDHITVQATTANGGTVVTYSVTAEDNADGTAILKEDGTTITQDDVRGAITISCEPASGYEFPIGETLVECTATDASGNSATDSFTVTVNPPPPPADTEAPLFTVLDHITVQATTANGGTVVRFPATAVDNVDGTATLQEDGSLVQDDVGGDISIECDPDSGSEFPIGETSVTCMAWDAAGNGRDASFTVTVNPPSTSTPTPAEATTELISDVENLGDDVPQGTKNSLTAPLRQAVDLLNDDNPNNDVSACGRLGAFLNQVDAAERRGDISEQQGSDLRTQAEDIRTQLDC